MNRRAQVVPIVLPCPACGAEYHLAVSMLKDEGRRERWYYTLPDTCDCCSEPLNTVAHHEQVRDAARMFL